MAHSESKQLQQEINALRKDVRNPALFVMAFCYSALISYWFTVFSFGPIWLLGLPLIGILQYYIVISGHEAVHKTLCHPPWLNEFLGVFGQALVGVNFNAYRLQHIDHHSCRSHETDPDSHIYFTVLSSLPGWRRFLRLTFGTVIEIWVKIIQKGSGGYGTERQIKPEIARKMKRDSFLVILSQVSLMAISTTVLSPIWAAIFELYAFNLPMWFSWLIVAPISYGLMWVLPLFGVTVFLNRCRICIEHGLALSIAAQIKRTGAEFGGPRIPTVDIQPGRLQQIVFAPFNFNYHCTHHLFMSVPHYHLPTLNALLREHQYEGHHQVQGSYIKALQDFMVAETP